MASHDHDPGALAHVTSAEFLLEAVSNVTSMDSIHSASNLDNIRNVSNVDSVDNMPHDVPNIDNIHNVTSVTNVQNIQQNIHNIASMENVHGVKCVTVEDHQPSLRQVHIFGVVNNSPCGQQIFLIRVKYRLLCVLSF